MKKLLFALFAIGIFGSCQNNESSKTTSAASTDTVVKEPAKVNEEPKATEPVLDSATQTQNWMAYMQPGEMHKMMAEWNGSWNAEMSLWMAPGAEPEKSKGTMVNKMVLGGRYQQGMYKGKMMGMDTEGISTLAYDNGKKVFISNYIDNTGTGVMHLEGPWDATTKSMSLAGSIVNAASGDGKEVPVREVFTIKDDKTQVMELFSAGPDGKEFKTMEIVFTRK